MIGWPGGGARGRWLARLAVGLAVVALSAGLARALGERGSGASSADAGWLAIPAPSVRFASLEGDSVSLADYRGRVVLLNFWGTWCVPCLTEIPHLISVQRKLEELGGTIIGPAVESGTPEEIRRFADAHGITWPVWIAGSESAVGRFGALGYPYTVLVDPEGVIRRAWLGPQTERTLMGDVRRLLRERAQRTRASDAGGSAEPTPL